MSETQYGVDATDVIADLNISAVKAQITQEEGPNAREEGEVLVQQIIDRAIARYLEANP